MLYTLLANFLLSSSVTSRFMSLPNLRGSTLIMYSNSASKNIVLSENTKIITCLCIPTQLELTDVGRECDTRSIVRMSIKCWATPSQSASRLNCARGLLAIAASYGNNSGGRAGAKAV